MSEGLDDRFGLVGRVVGGRYAVERPVARGGCGLVYRATHLELALPVALKVLVVPEHLRGTDASLAARFRREAQTLAELRHPAIVRVFDVSGFDAGGEACVWMALEWLDGTTLDAHLSALGGCRGPREVLALLSPVLDGIASAHALGIAHRDLKPANLMVEPLRGGGVTSRVLDFGIAKAMEPEESPGSGFTETRSDHGSYTLPYAAPEQVGRLRTGPWTDVHALGLIVTEALIGRAPYPGEDSFGLYAAVMAPERPTPGRLGVEVGPWEAVLAKAMALHPAERFADAGALHTALAEAQEAAQRAWERPVPTPSPEAAPSRRRASVGLLLASMVAVATLGAAATTWRGHTPAATLHARPVAAGIASSRVPVAVPPPSRPRGLAAPGVAAVVPVQQDTPRPAPAPLRVVRAAHRVHATTAQRPPAHDPDRIVME